jgi:poly-gamma-glutamate synthesis protein (capsule biosynthesis protein)
VADLSMMFVGDIILEEPDPRSFFDRSRTVLAGADVLVGHVEIPHTDRGTPQLGDVPASPAPPANLEALGWVGFDVATLAANHVYDLGPEGVADTVDGLRRYGIAPAGAGADLTEARQPARITRDGVEIGVLSYNCVGPRLSWAAADKAGCAYVGIVRPDGSYDDARGGPGGRDSVPSPGDLQAMAEDVARLRAEVDVVVVAFHKGVVHSPAVVLPYERAVAHAAVDAGADVVVGHHAHILRGIEIYRGKPVFHGLGNWVTVTRALDPDRPENAARKDWALRRRELFGFEPDPAMPTYPFHPESRNAVIGWVELGDGALRAGFVPCWIDDDAHPRPLGPGDEGDAVAAYVEGISAAAGFTTALAWSGDKVVAS